MLPLCASVALTFSCEPFNFVPYTMSAGFAQVMVGVILSTVSRLTGELLPAKSPFALT